MPPPKKEMARLEKDTKQNLAVLHFLQLIHKDIKPASILWSKKFKKFVFANYTLAQYVKTGPNIPTETYYEGTPEYMSPDMKVIKEGNVGLVDLYYNDAFALRKSLERMMADQASENEQAEGEVTTERLTSKKNV